ncbi:MAG: hypothetical protein R3F43_10635 [bacterium]
MTGLDVVGLSTCEEAREHVARTPAALVVASMDLGDEGPAEALTLLTGLRAPVLIMSGQVQPLQVDAGNVEVVPRAPLADLREHILGSLESRLWETLHAQHGGPVDVDEAADDEECAACADTIETMVDEILEGHERIALPAPEDFDLLMERAFDALLANDRQAAWKALHAARLLRPDHGLVSQPRPPARARGELTPQVRPAPESAGPRCARRRGPLPCCRPAERGCDAGGRGSGLRGLVDLAAASFRGVALVANDEFFAGRENLLKPGRGSSCPTPTRIRASGWMAGRAAASGAPATTPASSASASGSGAGARHRHHTSWATTPFASVEALYASADTPVELLEQAAGPRSCPAGAAARIPEPLCHQGLRHHQPPAPQHLPRWGRRASGPMGSVAPGWRTGSRTRRPPSWCSRARGPGGARQRRQGHRVQRRLLRPHGQPDPPPGAPRNMGGGWRRGAAAGRVMTGSSRLAAPGTVGLVEVDTKFFKELPRHLPARGVYAPGARPTDVIWGRQDWQLILPRVKLGRHPPLLSRGSGGL